MKITIIILFIISAGFNVLCQSLPIDVSRKYSLDYSDAGSGIIYTFDQTIIEKNNEDAKSLYKSAKVSFSNKNFYLAKKLFKEFLKTEFFNEDEKQYFPPQKESNILKNDACRLLANMYVEEKNFKLALKYIKLFSEDFNISSFCMNCSAYDELYVNIIKAKCYDGLGKSEDAINLLDEYMINGCFTDNKQAVRLEVSLLRKKYSDDELKSSLQNGFDSIYFDKDRFYLNFLNRKYDLHYINETTFLVSENFRSNLLTKEEAIQVIKKEFTKHILYKLIMEN